MEHYKFEWIKGWRGAWLVLIGKAYALHYQPVNVYNDEPR